MTSIGERLKQARLAKGWSQRRLAEVAAPLSAMSVSKYETGEAVPGSDVLLRLGAALGVKVSYFHRPTTVVLQCLAYRKHSRLPAKAQQALVSRISDEVERYLAVEELFSPDRLPGFSMPQSTRDTVRSLDDLETVAEDLRREWALGDDPFANLCESLEDLGFIVILLEDAPKRFDGFSCWANNEVPVVVTRGSADIPGDRQRFNLAHEVGHLLLACEDPVEEEKAAHRFAGAFLVPQTAVLREVGARRGTMSLQELYLLKHKWGLSIAAWTRRLKDLRVISDSEYRRLQILLRSTGSHLQEPGEPVPAETTQRFLRLVERAVAEDLISVSRAADFLNKPLIEVYGRVPGLVEVETP